MSPASPAGRNSPAGRLDPRSKLAVQAGFALAAFGWTDPAAPVVLTAVAGLALAAARLSPVAALAGYRLPLAMLAVAPVVAAATLGPPWLDPGAGLAAAVASYRVALVLLVGAAYVRATPVPATRAAFEWAVPGRPGRLLGVGVAVVLRFLPVLRADLGRTRAASRARLGDRRPLADRMGTVAAGGLRRALGRADRLALALRARCLAWNPTPPALGLSRRDYPVLAVAGLLAATPLLP